MFGLFGYGNNVIFKNCDAKHVRIINLAVNLFGAMRYYNVASRIISKIVLQVPDMKSLKKKHIDLIRKPYLED